VASRARNPLPRTCIRCAALCGGARVEPHLLLIYTTETSNVFGLRIKIIRKRPQLGMCVNVGRWPTASMARIVLTADLINTNQDRRVIGDRTRRISLDMRMPGSRQSPTLVRASVPAGNADTANDGGANAVVTRRSPPGGAVTQSRSAISITVTAVFLIGEAAQTSPSDSTGHAGYVGDLPLIAPL
jgi:hypothetical protein